MKCSTQVYISNMPMDRCSSHASGRSRNQSVFILGLTMSQLVGTSSQNMIQHHVRKDILDFLQNI